MRGRGVRAASFSRCSRTTLWRTVPYVIHVEFDDRTVQTIDFEPVLAGELFGPLRDPALFRQVRLDPEAHTLVWPNGAEHRGWALRFVTLASYVPALALGLAGIWRERRRGWSLVLCWLPAIYLTALHLVFVSSIRYREPAMLALLVPAAAVVRSITERHGGRSLQR